MCNKWGFKEICQRIIWLAKTTALAMRHMHNVSPCCSINYSKLQELLNVAEELLMCNKYGISLPSNIILLTIIWVYLKGICEYCIYNIDVHIVLIYWTTLGFDRWQLMNHSQGDHLWPVRLMRSYASKVPKCFLHTQHGSHLQRLH